MSDALFSFVELLVPQEVKLISEAESDAAKIV